MAIERKVGTLQMSGKLANTVYMRRKGETVSRALVIPSNPRYTKQMLNRVSLANLTFIYRAARNVLAGAFTDKKTKESDFNAFVRLNKKGYGVESDLVPRTKEEAAAGLGVLAPVKMSSGILPEIDMQVALGSEGILKFPQTVTAATVAPTVDKLFDKLVALAFSGNKAQAKFTFMCMVDGETGRLSQSSMSIPAKSTAAELTAMGFTVGTATEAGSFDLRLNNPFMGLFGFKAYAFIPSRKNDKGTIDCADSVMVLSIDAKGTYDNAIESVRWDEAISSYGARADQIVGDFGGEIPAPAAKAAKPVVKKRSVEAGKDKDAPFGRDENGNPLPDPLS